MQGKSNKSFSMELTTVGSKDATACIWGEYLDFSVRDALLIISAVSSGGHAIVIQIYSGQACTRVKVLRLGHQGKTALKSCQVFAKHNSFSSGAHKESLQTVSTE